MSFDSAPFEAFAQAQEDHAEACSWNVDSDTVQAQEPSQ